MFERMTVAQLKKEFPNGVPINTKSKSKRSNVRAKGSSDLLANPDEKKRSKYGNVKTEVSELSFDSQSEADRYSELRILERLGEIENLVLQPEYKLADGVLFEGDSRRKKDLLYIADFTYYCKKRAKQIIEDVKSPATAKCKVYRMKKHLMKAYLDLDITEIMNTEKQ